MTPIFFLHGFPLESIMWRPVEVAVKRKSFAMDFPGSGRGTGFSPGYESVGAHSIAAYARDYAGTIGVMMMQRGVFCGLSMGGYVVLELLRSFPDKVRAAILCNTKATPDTWEAKNGRDALAARARKEGMSAVVDEVINRLFAKVTYQRQPDLVDAVKKLILRQPVAGIVGQLHALRERPDATSLLGQIRVPVLVIAGDDDQITPADGMKEMARAIPGAEFVLIPDAGHLSALEQPAAVAEAINAFLAKVD